jgi:hypothetical protein
MKRKAKNLILAITVSVVAIFLPSLLFNKWIEGIVFFICHWFIREQFKEQYHHVIPSICRLITGTTFFFGVSFILPWTLSLLSAIPINYFIGWIGFTKRDADYYETQYFKLRAKLEAKNHFNVDSCTEDELIARCKELRFNKANTKLAIQFFIEKKSRKELAEQYCVESESIKQRKRRMKNKLNK